MGPERRRERRLTKVSQYWKKPREASMSARSDESRALVWLSCTLRAAHFPIPLPTTTAGLCSFVRNRFLRQGSAPDQFRRVTAQRLGSLFQMARSVSQVGQRLLEFITVFTQQFVNVLSKPNDFFG